MDPVWTAFVSESPVMVALLIMTKLWMRRDETRDARLERIAERSLESETQTRNAITEMTAELRELRRTFAPRGQG